MPSDSSWLGNSLIPIISAATWSWPIAMTLRPYVLRRKLEHSQTDSITNRPVFQGVDSFWMPGSPLAPWVRLKFSSITLTASPKPSVAIAK